MHVLGPPVARLVRHVRVRDPATHEGFMPLVHTFGVFMYRRALDLVELSIACADLPVRMSGFLPGVTTPGGPSHQAMNDVAVLRSLPNMSV